MCGEYWWIIPLVMMVFCFFMMRGARGSSMCGFSSRYTEHDYNKSDTALQVLEKQYARGAINKEEYEDKRKALNHSADAQEQKSI